LLAGLLAACPSPAQVPNNDIEQRRLLAAEEVVASSTTDCTVQWPCVDERLTGKCIEYHNDQWFEFRPPTTGIWYVNIGQQKCRDVRGVQLVALTGTPCQPATYRILTCASLGTQDNLFVPLYALAVGQPVLLNVDGYLKDYCGFTIQMSGQARGLPVLPATNPPGVPPAMSRFITLTWHVPDSLAAVRQCRVLRREQHEFRSREVATVALNGSALGARRADYARTDTLPGVGNYLYQVVVESADGTPPVVLKQQWVSYSQLRKIEPGLVGTDVASVVLPLNRYPPSARLAVYISDPPSGRRLRAVVLEGQRLPRQPERVFAQPWLDLGLRQVQVEIICQPRRGQTTTDRLLLPIVPAEQ
jgi:hypothetical protein